MIGSLNGCANRGHRILGQEEALKYGLTGIIHEARLCPTKFQSGVQIVSGECEYVTCAPKGKGVQCVAKKKSSQ